MTLQQECESGIIADPQCSAICRQHSRSDSVNVSPGTMQAIKGEANTDSARMAAASLQVQFNMISLIAQTECGNLPAFQVSALAELRSVISVTRQSACIT
ncbi:MAG: hypothetical protein DMG65_09700 [Candidatus Angelobacter sp. Gp1-AA117]|nr:MAG: hypothetical protein DMG65_09700 [Candidatus Angelobacter sp. Gp1-AA117]